MFNCAFYSLQESKLSLSSLSFISSAFAQYFSLFCFNPCTFFFSSNKILNLFKDACFICLDFSKRDQSHGISASHQNDSKTRALQHTHTLTNTLLLNEALSTEVCFPKQHEDNSLWRQGVLKCFYILESRFSKQKQKHSL